MGRPPLYRLTVNGYGVGMTTPGTTFEPDVNRMCDDPFGEFHCTRILDHDGDHVAHGGWPVRVVCSWPQPTALAVAALEHIERRERELRTRARFAKEIRAAHADPDWLAGF